MLEYFISISSAEYHFLPQPDIITDISHDENLKYNKAHSRQVR